MVGLSDSIAIWQPGGASSMGWYRPAATSKHDSCADTRTSDDMIKVLVNWGDFIRCRLMMGNVPLTYMRNIVFRRDYH